MRKKAPRRTLLFILIVVCALIAQFVVNADIDVKVTNIGFAVLIGLTSVCFSWVRTYEHPEGTAALRKKIRSVGESSLLTSIIFLLASIFKYSLFILKNNNPEHSIIIVVKIIAGILFFLAFYGLVRVMMRILWIIIAVIKE